MALPSGAELCGRAYTTVNASKGFAITALHGSCRYTFAHETGHNLGLQHDRYAAFGGDRRQVAGFPYGYGYSNARTWTLLSEGLCWSTVMAYRDHCASVPGGGDFWTKIPYFSNLKGTHPSTGEALGAAGEHETLETDGPADAARHTNAVRDFLAAYYERPGPDPSTEFDLAVASESVSASPDSVDPGGTVSVQAVVTNTGPGPAPDSARVEFWNTYGTTASDTWFHRASKSVAGLKSGSRTVSWTGAGGPKPGLEYWAVCTYAAGDADPNNDCGIGSKAVVVRDPVAADLTGRTAAGGVFEIEFELGNVGDGSFQVQPHWFEATYEPAGERVWYGVWNWWCHEDDAADCWTDGGAENPEASWDWVYRSWGFGEGGSVTALLGIEWFTGNPNKWRFTIQEALTYTGDEANAEMTWNARIVRETDGSTGPGTSGIQTLQPIFLRAGPLSEKRFPDRSGNTEAEPAEPGKSRGTRPGSLAPRIQPDLRR